MMQRAKSNRLLRTDEIDTGLIDKWYIFILMQMEPKLLLYGSYSFYERRRALLE